jgi:glycosyltransferase involved in cell wall biosynthesis
MISARFNQAMNQTQLSSNHTSAEGGPQYFGRRADITVMPSISVIINNYNYADYVGEAIESVLRQAADGVQCIVVDDGSTDNSLDVVRRYENILVLTRANGGQVAAVKTALPHANSDIIVFLDSDDYLHDNAISVIREAWRPGLTMLQFALDKVDARGNKLGRLPETDFVLRDSARQILKFGYIPHAPTSGNAFSRHYVEAAFASMDETAGRFHFDAFLIFGAPLFGPVAVMDKALGAYRVHGRNLTVVAKQKISLARGEIANHIWNRQSIEIFAKRANLKSKKAVQYLGPYHIRRMLLINRVYGGLQDSVRANNFFLAGDAIVKFLTYPEITIVKRIKNLFVIVFLLAGPKRLIRRMFPMHE